MEKGGGRGWRAADDDHIEGKGVGWAKMRSEAGSKTEVRRKLRRMCGLSRSSRRRRSSRRDHAETDDFQDFQQHRHRWVDRRLGVKSVV